MMKLKLLKKYFLPLSLIILFSFGLSHNAIAIASSQQEVDLNGNFSPLVPTRDQREASIHIARSLLLNHYRKQDIDKELSEKVYNFYLDSLDSQHLYLLESDIKEFEPYRFRLHNALKTGQLEPGFRIFNRYQERVIARLRQQIKDLNKGFKNLDFKKAEYILTDRSETALPKNADELNDVWRRRIKSAALSLILDGKTEKEAQETLIKRYENQLKRTLQSQNEDAFQIYMNAFTNVYDPHTSYFSPRTSENFNINMSLSLEGIGAVLQSDNEYTKVVRLVPGGPAQKQGQLSPADRIVGVAQGDKEMINVVGWRLDEVVELIRGDKHSLVRLEVIPTESQLDTETEVIPIIRDKVKLEEQAASSSKVIIERNGKSHTIGVIDLPTFYADFQAMQQGDPNYKSTTRDVLRLLNELQTEDAIEGLVIDLRGNGGGSLDEANRLTGLFINEGPTVQVRNANNRVEVLEDPDPELVYNGPLIVLVDRLSASASEIFAGAIQDYGRGIIMGSQTFGKGTVQSVRPLNHGQLKITQAKFYRISGASTQHKGVVPDIIVPALIDKTKVGEDSLEHALKWDSIQSAKFKNLNYITGVSETLTEKHMKRIVLQPEYNILLEEIALLETQRARDRVTLNKKERELENITFDKAQLTIINKRRALDKLASFKSIDDWTEFQKEQASKTEDDKEKDKADFVIKESAEVLLDFVELQEVLTAKAS
ncbi:MAG: carboxyl-terminal processing protease [Pseudohongiellaceae bacterium]|jgi:carboxyl-terminal processing protease